jgi:hypothetical protein
MAYLIYNTVDGSILGVKYNLDSVGETIGHYGSDYDYIDAPDDFDTVEYVSVVNGVAVSKQIDPYEELRQQRGLLLQKSDWTQANDSPLSASKRTEWATYRQALRDLPENTQDPTNPIWPTRPQ